MFTEDRAAFLADFGEDVLVAGAPVRGLFDAAYVDALGVAAAAPAFSAFEVDLPALTVGLSTVVRGAETYRIVNRQPDGTGWAALILERQ